MVLRADPEIILARGDPDTTSGPLPVPAWRGHDLCSFSFADLQRDDGATCSQHNERFIQCRETLFWVLTLEPRFAKLIVQKHSRRQGASDLAFCDQHTQDPLVSLLLLFFFCGFVKSSGSYQNTSDFSPQWDPKSFLALTELRQNKHSIRTMIKAFLHINAVKHSSCGLIPKK